MYHIVSVRTLPRLKQIENTMKKPLLQRYYIQVLGCKVNQYDAQQIAELLNRYGLEAADQEQQADLLFIHTCGVTAAAAQKSRQTIRRLQRKNPNARIIVTGCAAKDNLTAVDADDVIRIPAGNEWLKNIAYALEELPIPTTGLAEYIRTDETIISDFNENTRAFLKIQDGCDIGCSFCIVPSLRKAPRDKPLQTAIQEATELTKRGYREIVITGVSVGLYGRDSDHSLADVLREIITIPNIGRIRLSSLHPGELTEELLAVWASSDRIMPHLHLSLQSGSDPVLAVMRRGYTTEEYYHAVERARAALPNPAFTTDLIVGFPGETDAYFQESLDFCRKVGFSQMHVFNYSPRPGTRAEKMPNQVHGSIASERSKKMRSLAKELSLNYHRKFIQQPVEVLVEKVNRGICEGYSEHYLPVRFPGNDALKGTCVPVQINHAESASISGQPLPL